MFSSVLRSACCLLIVILSVSTAGLLANQHANPQWTHSDQVGLSRSAVLQDRATPVLEDRATAAGKGTNVSPLPSGWTYRGCYIDNAHGGHDLIYQNPDSQTLTIESCVATCVSKGYSVAGLEYSSQCFCGNDIQNGGALATSDTDCSLTCSGNNKEICGNGVGVFCLFLGMR